MHSVPDFVSTSGDEAVELATLAGLHLDPWQQLVLRDSLGERVDGKWSAFEVGVIVPRQNGKGSLLEARELAGLFLLEERLILHSAHEFKTSQEAFRRILSLIENTPSLSKKVAKVGRSHGEEGIELKDGRRLRFVARSSGSGRGFTADCIILDEAYNLPSETMAALLPTLSAVPNPQIWYTSSAGMESSEQLRKVRERGIGGSSKRLAYFEWSARTPAERYEDALDDREEWARANPALGIRIPEEFVEAERDAMGGFEFARERLGIWYDEAADVVISGEVWRKLADPASQATGPVVFAVDVAPDRSVAAISAAGERSDGLLHVEVIEHRPGTEWLVPRLTELKEKWNPPAFILDPSGPAGSLLPALQDKGVEPETTTAREMAQACGSFYDLAVNDGLRHLDQPPLNRALAGAKTRPLGDAWAWARKDSKVDISPLVSATLAAYGFAVYGHPEEKTVNLW